MNAAGYGLLKDVERGPRGESPCLYAYPDNGGVPTIGWGHTGAYPAGIGPVRPSPVPSVAIGDRIDAVQAEALLHLDAAVAEQAVNRLVDVDLTETEVSALACLVFNVGVGAFANSYLRRVLNAGRSTWGAWPVRHVVPGFHGELAYEWLTWDHTRVLQAGGSVVLVEAGGLKRRRASEYALFRRAATTPVELPEEKA